MLPNVELFVCSLIYEVKLIVQKQIHTGNVNKALANLVPKTNSKE